MSGDDAVSIVADTLRTHRHGGFRAIDNGPFEDDVMTSAVRCKCGEDFHAPTSWQAADAHEAHVAAAVVDALGGLEREEQWTPVQADGDRWQPRDEALALAALDLYGINGPANFPDTSPVVSIEHEARWVSAWVREPAEETP